MGDIVDLVVSNGIGVACIVYFMFRDYKFMSTLQKTLDSLNESTTLIEKYFIENIRIEISIKITKQYVVQGGVPGSFNGK